jgi:hypothetical protein
MSLRETNEGRLAGWLRVFSTASPLVLLLCIFYVWSSIRGWLGVAGCVALLLMSFAVYVGLSDIGMCSRKTRMGIWVGSAAFHFGLAFLVWNFIGGFGFLLAAFELIVAIFSVGGFFVARASIA